jgi:hypothetical protein
MPLRVDGAIVQNDAMAVTGMTSEDHRATTDIIEASASYYALTLTADNAGNVVWSSFSEWVGEGSKAMWEMRAPSLVRPQRALAGWVGVRQDWTVVNDLDSLGSFLGVGGHALVENSIAQRWLPSVLQPVECVGDFLWGETRLLEEIPKKSLDHAPSKKLRMDILRRDDFRCKICGRRASDNVDIVLHVHHIVPHSMGGLTEPGNLITLCHTCHLGLDPHFEARLFGMVPTGKYDEKEIIIQGCTSHANGVRLYRSLSKPAVRLTSPNLPKRPESQTVNAAHLLDGTGSTSHAVRQGLEEKYTLRECLNFWIHGNFNSLRKFMKPHEACAHIA